MWLWLAQQSLLGPELHRNVKQGSSSKETGVHREAPLKLKNKTKSPGRGVRPPTATRRPIRGTPSRCPGGYCGNLTLPFPLLCPPGPATLGPDTQPTPPKGREFVGPWSQPCPHHGPCKSRLSPQAWGFAPHPPPSSRPTIINSQVHPNTKYQHRLFFRKRKTGSTAGCVRGNLTSAATTPGWRALEDGAHGPRAAARRCCSAARQGACRVQPPTH